MADQPDHPLADRLIALERRLHDPAVRCDIHALGDMLHPDFREIGYSSRLITRAALLDALSSTGALDASPRIVAWRFQVRPLTPTSALVTYHAGQRVDSPESVGRLSRRSSLWLYMGALAAWQMRFHHAQPIAAVGAPGVLHINSS